MFCEFCSTDISGWSHLDKYFHFLRHYKVKLGSWYTNLAQYYNDRNLVRNHPNSWYARLLSKINILRISEKCWILQTIIKFCKWNYKILVQNLVLGMISILGIVVVFHLSTYASSYDAKSFKKSMKIMNIRVYIRGLLHMSLTFFVNISEVEDLCCTNLKFL